MRMANMKLEEFMGAVKAVNAALADTERYAAFLDESSSDTPIIGELLDQLALLEAMPDSAQKRKGLAAANRDLVVLLALRHLEKTEGAITN